MQGRLRYQLTWVGEGNVSCRSAKWYHNHFNDMMQKEVMMSRVKTL